MSANPALRSRTSDQRVPSKRLRKKSASCAQVSMCIADCKYDAVRDAARAKGWKLVDEDPEESTRKCHVYWIDVPAIVERMQHLHRWQRINHFPGVSNIARKGRLAQNLDRMRRSFPYEYSFYPRTWVLPAEWGGFKAEFDASGKSTRTFIVKPDSGCQGRGIFLTQDLERVASMESQVAQLYIQKPLLIDGFKFDLRLYVLVTSVIPLRVYAFKDGLTRFCTEEYIRAASSNLGERCMHLTNYAVNKRSDNFVANDRDDRDDLGSKRSLRWLLGWIASEHGQEKADALWRRMGSAIVKTLISILPTLQREYLNTFGPDMGVPPTRDKPGNQPTNARSKESGSTLDPNFRATDDVCGNEVLGESLRKYNVDRGGDVASPSNGNGATESPRREARPVAEDGDLEENGESARVGAEGDGEDELGNPTCLPDGSGDAIGISAGGDTAGEGVVEGSRCVQILGFDFMIDAALKPWLVEVNHLPSFATDSPMDKRIKSQVVSTALSVLRAKADDRKSYEECTKRDAQNRLYNPESLAAVSSLRDQERKETEAALAKIRRKVEAIYLRFAPNKLGKVVGLLARYAGNEEKLLRLVRRKYVDAVPEPEPEPVPCDGDVRTSASAPAHGSDAGDAEFHAPVTLISDPPKRQAPEIADWSEASRGKGLAESWSTARRADSQGAAGAPWKQRDAAAKQGPTAAVEVAASAISRAPQDPEDLSREAEILEGWERLHPLPEVPHGAPNPFMAAGGTPSEAEKKPDASATESQPPEPVEATEDGGTEKNLGASVVDGGDDVGGAGGGGAKGGRRRRKSTAVELLIQRAFEDDRKMTLRLKCPLQQQRGAAMDQQPAAKLPLVGQVAPASDQSRASPAVLCPEQREKAQRLMEGYSSGPQRSSSAPSGGGQEANTQLPEWRRRRDEDVSRRSSRAVAVKVHTFDFGGVSGGQA